MSTTLVQTANERPVGTIKSSYHLFRASWSALKISPEVIHLQLLSVASALIVTLVAGALIWLATDISSLSALEHMVNNATWFWIIPFFLYIAITTVIGAFFMGAITSAILERFAGREATVASSLQKAKEKTKPLIGYGLFQTTVLLAFQLISSWIDSAKLPFLGKLFSHLTANIASASISFASMFAIPVIMTSKDDISPLEAIKGSANLIGKTWGQGIAFNFGFSFLVILAFIPIFISGAVAGTLAAAVGLHTLFITLPITIVLAVGLTIVVHTLNTIFQVALFKYATTDESPASFDKNMMKAAFVPKKKWFV